MDARSRAGRAIEVLASPGLGFLGGLLALVLSFVLDQIVLPSERAKDAEAFAARTAPLARSYGESAEQLRAAREGLADAMLLGSPVPEAKRQFREFQKAQRSFDSLSERLNIEYSRSPILNPKQKDTLREKIKSVGIVSRVLDRCVTKAIESYNQEAVKAMFYTESVEGSLRCPVWRRDSRYILLDGQMDIVARCHAALSRAAEATVYAAAAEGRVSVLGVMGRGLSRLLGARRPTWAEWASIQADLDAQCPADGRWASWQPNTEQLYPWQRAIAADEARIGEEEAAAATATDAAATSNDLLTTSPPGWTTAQPSTTPYPR